MTKEKTEIDGIPAVLWGNKSDSMFIAVHGSFSNKEDTVIAIFADEAVSRGYQVLSFDLPEHGERKDTPTACSVQNCVHDLDIIMRFAQCQSKNISVFACSMGAYFSLLSYANLPLKQTFFLSPVTDMERIIRSMMQTFNISEERLESEREIPTPAGQTLYWDYFHYVVTHPITSWSSPTSILYGSLDFLCEEAVVRAFAKTFGCELKIMGNGEHYFHTAEQLAFFTQWLKDALASLL